MKKLQDLLIHHYSQEQVMQTEDEEETKAAVMSNDDLQDELAFSFISSTICTYNGQMRSSDT
jgi:hypothetical protein